MSQLAPVIGGRDSEQLEVRPLTEADREGLIELCRGRQQPTSQVLNSEQLSSREIETLERALEDLSSGELFSRVVLQEGRYQGFAVCRPRYEEGITGESETVVEAWVASTKPVFEILFRHCANEARALGDDHLVFHAYSCQNKEKIWAYSCGFREELVRTYLKVSAQTAPGQHPDYVLRRAKASEMLYIMRVASNHSPRYLPANRDVDSLTIQTNFVNAYTQLAGPTSKKLPLVLAQRSTNDLAGYVIVEAERLPGGQLGLYIHDVAVGPEKEGLGLSLYLALGTQKLLAQMGGGFLYGDISASNKPAINTQKNLGFVADSSQWGIPLSGSRAEALGLIA